MTPCRDEDFCQRNKMSITQDPCSSNYGRVICTSDSEDNQQSDAESYHTCSRYGIFCLHIQERILRFLYLCTKIILHDIPLEEMLAQQVVDEPSLSELLEQDNNAQSNFSDILMTAPYRGWHSRNFTKLRDYVAAALDTQKDHIIALHEDPSYFADALRENEDHFHTLSKEHSRSFLAKQRYRNTILRSTVENSYCELASWQELHKRFSEFDKLFQEGANVHDQIHAVREVEYIAKWAKTGLANELGYAIRSAPKI
jgi:hypothetical protein